MNRKPGEFELDLGRWEAARVACPNCGCRPERPDPSLPLVACVACGWSLAKQAMTGPKFRIDDVTVVDRAALAAAAATLRAHRTLLEGAYCDRRGGSPYPEELRKEARRQLDGLLGDLGHVLDDDHRSEESRGGS